MRLAAMRKRFGGSAARCEGKQAARVAAADQTPSRSDNKKI